VQGRFGPTKVRIFPELRGAESAGRRGRRSDKPPCAIGSARASRPDAYGNSESGSARSTCWSNVGWTGRAQFFLEIPPERWARTFALNLGSTFSVTRAVLPRMVERREGVVISLSSDAAWGEPRMGDYGAMKAGILGFTRGLAKEYRGFGIRFNAVSPGLVIPQGSDAIGEGSVWSLCTGSDPSTVSADFGEREIRSIEAGIPLRRRSTAQDVAWSVVFLASACAPADRPGL
jgi:2-hydroxycyclohexanecarboxyl-CoA dehydrogenase